MAIKKYTYFIFNVVGDGTSVSGTLDLSVDPYAQHISGIQPENDFTVMKTGAIPTGVIIDAPPGTTYSLVGNVVHFTLSSAPPADGQLGISGRLLF